MTQTIKVEASAIVFAVAKVTKGLGTTIEVEVLKAKG